MNEDQVAEHAETLPDRFADRVGEPYLAILRAHAAGGAWEELLPELVANLAGQPVTVAERDELRALLQAVGESTEGLDKVNVQP